MKNLLGGWQISGATFMRTGTPFSRHAHQRHRRRGRRRLRPAVDLVGDLDANANKQFSTARPRRQLLVQPGRVRAARRPARSATAPRNLIYNPGEQQWDIALFKNFSVGGARRAAVPRGVFNFLNHPNLAGTERRHPTNANFGRITSKIRIARHPAQSAVLLLIVTNVFEH